MKNWRVALGSLSSWSWWVVNFTLAVRLLVALVSDPNRTENYSPLWLVIWLIGVGAMTAWVLLAMALGLKARLKTKPRPFANILVISFAGVIGNGIVGLLAISWGLDTEGLWHVRLIGGAAAAAVMFALINLLRTNMVTRKESIRKLQESEHQLRGYRESAQQILADEIERLKKNTLDALLPAIEKIQSLFEEKTQAKTEMVETLKMLIHQEVRPLSKSVLNEAASLSNFKNFSERNPGLKNRWGNKSNLKNSMRPSIALPVMLVFFPMIEFITIDHRSALRGFLGAIAAGIALMICKALIPKSYEAKTARIVCLQSLMATLAILPAYWIMWQEYGNTSNVLYATLYVWLTTIALTWFLSYTKAIEINQERFEQALNSYNAELAKEVALFEQKLGLEKRAWSRVIHGEVQSALTAALTRLQRSETLEPYQFEMIRQDLSRARDNLLNPPKSKSNFEQNLGQVVSTWNRICAITTDISARAKRAVDNNEDTQMVTNEIIKEAVSNAIRHGDAKNISIKLDRIQDDLLEIEIANDGYMPLRDRSRGLGSQMLDELTLDWNLEIINKRTTLKARVPISKN